jgi:hypothetical protein
MNPQNHPEYIYAVRCPLIPGFVKIGFTAGTVKKRIAELSSSTSVPAPFELVSSLVVPNAYQKEHILHTALAPYRQSATREFFRLTVQQTRAIFRILEERFSSDQHWNMDLLGTDSDIFDTVLALEANATDIEMYQWKGVQLVPPVPPKLNTKNLICPYCNCGFAHQQSLNRHVKGSKTCVIGRPSGTVNEILECECGYATTRTDHLTKHKKTCVPTHIAKISAVHHHHHHHYHQQSETFSGPEDNL